MAAATAVLTSSLAIMTVIVPANTSSLGLMTIVARVWKSLLGLMTVITSAGRHRLSRCDVESPSRKQRCTSLAGDRLIHKHGLLERSQRDMVTT